jgi:asparagine synthase (glutamine-hydrolysing)
MAFGIEARVPFLDNDLADFALGLPAALKMQGAEAKFILRRSLRGIISNEVLDGSKTGFSVPYVNWIRGPLYTFTRDAILDAATGPNPWFDETALRRLLDDLNRCRYNGFLLWKCLHLALWRRQQKL